MVHGLVPRRRRGWRYGVFRDTRNIGWTTSRWGWSACLKKRQTFSKSTLRLPPDLSHFKSCCAKISDFNYQKSHKTTFEKLTHSHRAQCARWSILISSLVILINYSFFEKNTRCNSEFDAVNWIVWLLKKADVWENYWMSYAYLSLLLMKSNTFRNWTDHENCSRNFGYSSRREKRWIRLFLPTISTLKIKW